MTIQTAEQLYQEVMEAFDTLYGRLPHIPEVLSRVENLRYREGVLNSYRLHFVGEAHWSREPIEYVHDHMVHVIESDPSSWIIFREAAWDRAENASEAPPHFYFQDLARLFGIPYHDALENIFDKKVKERIEKTGDVTEVEIDRCLAHLTLSQDRQEAKNAVYNIIEYLDDGKVPVLEDLLEFKQVVSAIASTLQVSEEYAISLLSKLPLSQKEFDNRICSHWNTISKERFIGILGRYPDRPNVLISAGISHLEAFLPHE